jgi:hypothetical protein
MPRTSLPYEPGLVEDLAAVKVGERYLGSGHQVEAVLHSVHLPLLVGQLAGRPGGLRIDQQRRNDLLVVALLRPIEEVSLQCPHEAGAMPSEDREAGPAYLDPRFQVDPATRRGQLPVRLGLEVERR